MSNADKSLSQKLSGKPRPAAVPVPPHGAKPLHPTTVKPAAKPRTGKH